jgi:ketosteroid isomerase-like protein
MKTLLLMITAFAIGSSLLYSRPSAADSMQQQIILHERAELDALKTGDTKAFANLIADEAVFVDSRGSAGKAEVVSHVNDFRLLEYSMDEIRFVALSDKSGVIAYKLTEKGSSHDHEFTATAYASAVWVERGNKWVCVFSQETAARAQK